MFLQVRACLNFVRAKFEDSFLRMFFLPRESRKIIIAKSTDKKNGCHPDNQSSINLKFNTMKKYGTNVRVFLYLDKGKGLYLKLFLHTHSLLTNNNPYHI